MKDTQLKIRAGTRVWLPEIDEVQGTVTRVLDKSGNGIEVRWDDGVKSVVKPEHLKIVR